MLAFFLGAAALLALALAFVLPTLWNGARRSAIALLVAVPLGAVALYAGFGTPDALDPANRRAPANPAEAVAQAERRVARDGGSFDSWALLGNARLRNGEALLGEGKTEQARTEFTLALAAFEKARDLNAADPHLLADTASATLLSAGDDEAIQRANALFDQALANLPDHPGALMLGGVAALRSGDSAKAIERWEKLIPMVGNGEAATLRRMVEGARGATNTDASPMQAGPAPGSPGTVTVVLDAAPEAVASMPPGAVLFVFARDAEAGGPPVAAQRIPAPRFPLTVVLSDADRLMPTASLSQTARLQLSARFSRSGSVQSETGDLVAPPVIVELAKAAPVALALAPSEAATDVARAPTFDP